MKHQCLQSIWVVFCELPDSSEFQNILWGFYHFNIHLLDFPGLSTVTEYQFHAVFSGLVSRKKNIVPEIFHAENYQFTQLSSS